ncbi:hypothetical protein BC832DRAFT_547975 [Gaertneriomyces semiglobifer]|nr:hypothetical protein BC832DRAFT_547975 [Gaertneriomyces semiglobifer]
MTPDFTADENVPLVRSLSTTVSGEELSRTSRADECMNYIIRLSLDRIRQPVKPSHISDRNTYLHADDITALRELGKKSCVYGCLAAYRLLSCKAENSLHRADILNSRALFCQIAAVRLVQSFASSGKDGLEELFVDLLTSNFKSLKGGHGIESALEVAVESDAVIFINDTTVQQCVQYIWRGQIVPAPKHIQDQALERNGDYAQAYMWPSQVKTGFAALPVGRLRIPLYQYASETIFYLILLIVYTIVVNDRTAIPGPMEIILWVLVLGFAISEFQQFISQGSGIYFLTLFNSLDLMALMFFGVSFGFRVAGIYEGNDDVMHGSTDMAYDLLACNAVFLWMRCIHVFSGLRYFGEMVVIIRAMIRDTALFFVMFAFVFIGFIQAFAGLSRKSPSEDPGFVAGAYLLAKSFLQSPAFDEAEDMHPNLGPPLLIFFMILATTIMLNMLIAFLNQSYSNVVEAATQQHVAQFTLKVLAFYLQPTDWPLVPPTNILEVTIFPVAHLVLPRRMWESFRRITWVTVCLPANCIIATVETIWPGALGGPAREDEEKEEEAWEDEMRHDTTQSDKAHDGKLRLAEVEERLRQLLDEVKQINANGST